MSEAFLKVVNMSISAGWLVLVVLALRLILKRAPKWVNVLLWGIVAVRLICPFSIESALSLIPSTETISPEIMMDWTPEISTGIESLDQVVNPVISTSFAPEPSASANPLQILIPVAAILWLLGVIIMLGYTAISYLTLRRKLRTAVILRGNIFQCETVSSPFVLGIVKPRIYLPYTMDGKNLDHVVAHEQAHIQRKDHWWKPLGFLLLTVYWFNPLMWVAYIMLCRDIELACDEKVIAELGNEQRADYTQALVACAVNRRMIAACPLAFGEVGVKDRVKSIMNYQKPTFWIIVTALVVCVVVAVCFLTDPNPSREFSMNSKNVSGLDPEAIVERILDIEDITNSGVHVNTSNFPIQVDSNFNWADSQTVSFFFKENRKTYSSQLRIYPEDDMYFLTEPDEWPEQEVHFLLRHYLDAIKYLPQYEIQQMAPADQYIIQHVENGRPSDYERVITYTQNGVKEIDGWFIHLQIQPLHADGEGYSGSGDEVIELFYGQTIAESLENTKIVIRNLHNGKDTTITDSDDVESIVAFLNTVGGSNPTSSKGYYGGSYQIQAFNGSEEIFSIAFGDDESFNCDEYGDGYPIRYELRGVTRENIIRFFSQFDSSGFDWGLSGSFLQATVLEIHDGYFLVEPVEGSWELSSASKIEVSMKNMHPSPEPQIGDILEIEYDGQIQETYPTRITEVFSIRVAEEAEVNSVTMIPTSADLRGLHAGALFVPINGSTYRYDLSEADPKNVTADELLDTFTEDTGFEQIPWEVYSLKEYPDKSAVLMISGTQTPWLCRYRPPRRCSDDALQNAINSGYAVMEDGTATHGQNGWQEFYDATRSGEPASITVASYFTLEPEHCSDEYYEAFREDYPCLYLHELRYDGEDYTLYLEDGVRTYEYLMKYEISGTPLAGSTEHQRVIYYVLTHDNSVTWEQLWNGLVSSQMGAYIDHYSIYTEKTQ